MNISTPVPFKNVASPGGGGGAGGGVGISGRASGSASLERPRPGSIFQRLGDGGEDVCFLNHLPFTYKKGVVRIERNS